MATMDEMVNAVKTYAMNHYLENGWDSIVECYSDSELAAEIAQGNCTTVAQAIAYVGKGCKVWNDYRLDIIAEGGESCFK